VEINTWEKCFTTFLKMFFPLGKTNALRGRITNFRQTTLKYIPEAWEKLQECILACPRHGMEEWLFVQSFYNGLTLTAQGHIDTAARGAFFSLSINAATTLIEKMVCNQGWSDDWLQPC
jgi:hypothetical protein